MAETAVASQTLVDVRDLKMHFPLTQGIIVQRVIGYVRAVDGVSFSIERGQTMGLVGESGSGKTTIGRTIVRLYKPTAGQIMFGDKDMAHGWRGIAPVAPTRADDFSGSFCLAEPAFHNWIINC